MYFKNHLLIASPGLEDSIFSGSVMIVCNHNAEGALGIIVNRPTNIRMRDVYHQLALINDDDEEDDDYSSGKSKDFTQHPRNDGAAGRRKSPVRSNRSTTSSNAKFAHFGGPINSERGLVLHEKMGDWQYSINVNNYIDLTTSQDILKALAHGNGPKRNVFVLGYAGWNPGQLEKEILENSWLTIPLSYHEKNSHSYQKHNHFQTEFSIIYDLLFSTPAELQWRRALELLGISPEKLSDQYGHA